MAKVNNMEVLSEVYSFGENEDDKWYAHKDGVRIKCDEYIIDKLWWEWIVTPGAEKVKDGTYTIFKVTEKGINILKGKQSDFSDQAIKWEQTGKDGFKADIDGYTLIAIKGFYNDVWWKVRYNGVLIGNCWINDKDDISDVEEAKRRAVNCMNEHKIKNEKP